MCMVQHILWEIAIVAVRNLCATCAITRVFAGAFSFWLLCNILDWQRQRRCARNGLHNLCVISIITLRLRQGAAPASSQPGQLNGITLCPIVIAGQNGQGRTFLPNCWAPLCPSLPIVSWPTLTGPVDAIPLTLKIYTKNQQQQKHSNNRSNIGSRIQINFVNFALAQVVSQ